MKHGNRTTVNAAMLICLGLLTYGGISIMSGEKNDQYLRFGKLLSQNSNMSIRAEILHSGLYVEGYPLIVGLRLEEPKSSRAFPAPIYFRDLASTFERSSGFAFLLIGEGDDLPCFLQGRWLSEPFDAPDRLMLASGGSVVMWIDIAQLIVPTNHLEEANSYPHVGVFPREGAASLAWTTTEWASASSPIVDFDVRKANPEEISIAEVLQNDGVGRSWFPAAFFVQEDVPEAAHLPPESRRVVALIDVMRRALRDSNQGVIAIESYDQQLWGYMSELVATVKYECLRDSNRDSEAGILHAGLPAKWGQSLSMVDRGGGLVRRLRGVRDGEVDYIKEMNRRQLEELPRH